MHSHSLDRNGLIPVRRRLWPWRREHIHTSTRQAVRLHAIGSPILGHDVFRRPASRLLGPHDAVDHHHGANMAVRTLSQRLSGQSFEAVAVVGRRIGGRLNQDHPERLPATLSLRAPMAIAEEAVVSDAVESIRRRAWIRKRRMNCLGGKGHGLLAIVIPIILPLETNLAAVHGHQPVTGDGDPMGIAAVPVEKPEQGPAKGRFAWRPN